jgi:hypothetical protein
MSVLNIRGRRIIRRFVLRACKYYGQTTTFYWSTHQVQFYVYGLYFLEASGETLHRASDSLLAFCLKISPTKKFCDHCTFECHRRHFSFLFIAGLSVFGLGYVWIGTSERVTYQKFAGRDGWKGTRGGKLSCLHLLPSFIQWSACWALTPR